MPLLFLVFTLMTSAAFAKSHDHEYVGIHGMAVLKSPNNDLLMYHLPLHVAPHDYQILYQVSLSKSDRVKLQKLESITALPEKFNLSKLINGETLSLNVTFYQGHFERGGTRLFDAPVTFLRPLFIKKLPTYSKSKTNGTPNTKNEKLFTTVEINPATPVTIHHLTSKPTFDLIVFSTIPKSGLNQPHNSEYKACNNIVLESLNEQSISNFAETCFSTKPAYIEYKDFQ